MIKQGRPKTPTKAPITIEESPSKRRRWGPLKEKLKRSPLQNP